MTPARTANLFPPWQRQSTICELIFPTSVLAVKMNRKRLIVVLENEIYIYDISTMKLLHTIETGPNPNGRPRPTSCFAATNPLGQLYVLCHPPLSGPISPTHPLRHQPPQHLFRLPLSLRHHQLPQPVTFFSLTPSRSPLSMSFKRTRRPSLPSLSTLQALCLPPLLTRALLFAYSAYQTPRSCGNLDGALPAQESLV